MYFEIMNFLEEQKKTDPTRWFTAREITTALQREEDFSERCIRHNLKKLRENKAVYSDRLIGDPEVKVSFFKKMYVYKSKQEV